MANIKNELNNIKSAIYGKDVRGSIHDGIDAINKEVESTTGRQVDLENTFDQLVINAGNSNAEIVEARVKNDGTSYSKLGDRLDAVDSQLAQKANKNEVFSMANMGQDVKEAMTGGSVAVIGINTVLTENIVDKQVTAEKIKDIIHDASINKVNTEKLSDGYLISSGLTGSSSYKTTDYIPVNNGDTVRFYRDVGVGGNALLRLYDSNLEHIKGLDGSLDETSTYKTVTIDAKNVAYARFSFQAKNVNVAMLTINADYPVSFEAFYDNGYKFTESYKLNNTQKLEVDSIVNSYINPNPLDGKIISFLGDSICYGDGFLGGYGKIIAEQNNMIYENLGRSGSTIASGTIVSSTGSNRDWICRRISQIRSDADYIILEGGVNDGGVGVLIGEVTNGYTATLDDTTFCGAFESMLKQTIDRFPGKKIGFIITHRMSESFATFYPKIIEICEKWGIPYCDLFTKCPSLNYIPYLKANYTKNGDGWHPNEAGYRNYYVPKIEAWLKTL